MGLKDFLAKSAEMAPKPFDRNQEESDSKKIKTIWMNAQSNQGIIDFIPIVSLTGEEVKYLYDVCMFQTYTDNEDGTKYWRWSRVFQQKDYNTQLTQDQIDQIGRLQSYIEAVIELGYGNDWARQNKNFALIFGYVIKHVNTDGEILINSENREMALIVCPSKNFAKAMTALCESLSASPSGDVVYDLIFNRNAEKRPYFLEMSFKPSSGFGYDVIIQAKNFDLLTQDLLIGDEKLANAVNVPQDLIDMCKSQSALFAGNTESTEDFIPEYMNRLEEQIKIEINKSTAASASASNLPPVPEDPTANQSKEATNWPGAN